MADFKLSVLWSSWTPKIQSRVMRDVIALQRLATTNRMTLVIACDASLRANIESLGVKATGDFTDPDMCRVYLASGSTIPDDMYTRLPDNVEPEIVTLQSEEEVEHQRSIEEDPYAGVKFYKDWTRIPETMPLDKPAPRSKGPQEPPYSPYL